MTIARLAIAAVLLVVVGIACSKPPNAPPVGRTNVQPNPGSRIIIRDVTGKEWDITHAVNTYGFDPTAFEFGIGPDAIPPVFNPVFSMPGEAEYPNPSSNEIVLGIELAGEPRGYSLVGLSRHEVINDKFGATHMAVAYWPLVDLAAVYSRELDGSVLSLAASGWTYEHTFVLYDHQSESMWYHLRGTNGLTCIAGAHADRFLPEAGAIKSRWAFWFQEKPTSAYWLFWRTP